MLLKFHVVRKKRINAVSCQPGEIVIDQQCPVKIYRRKMGGTTPVYLGTTTNRVLSDNRVQPWHEYLFAYAGDDFNGRYYFTADNIKIEEREIDWASSRMLNAMPENLYKKRDPASNVYQTLTAIGSEMTRTNAKLTHANDVRSFRTLNPLAPDLKHYIYEEEIERPFYNETQLIQLTPGEELVPFKYQLSGKRKNLHFGYDELGFFSAALGGEGFQDEKLRNHRLVFYFDNIKGKLQLLSLDDGNIFGMYDLYSQDGVRHLDKIDGIDYSDNQIFVLSDNRLYRYSKTQHTIADLSANFECGLNTKYSTTGLKMGDGFLVTASDDLLVFKAEYNRYALESNAFVTFGDARSVVDMCQTGYYRKAEESVRLTTAFDRQLELFGFERVGNVRNADFLCTVSDINFKEINASSDPVDTILKQSDSIYERRNVHTLDRMTKTVEEERRMLSILKQRHNDSVDNLKWGGRYG